MKLDKTTTKFILALIGILFSMSWFVLLIFKEAPEGNRDLISAITGALIAICIKEIYGYYFGSSQGSSDKTEMMNRNVQDKTS